MNTEQVCTKYGCSNPFISQREYMQAGDYFQKHGVTCLPCISSHIQSDGRLEVERRDDTVIVTAVFDESVFASHCYHGRALPTAMSLCGYTMLHVAVVINTDDTECISVTVPYEPEIISKLKGRGTFADVMRQVRSHVFRRTTWPPAA
jgi:hypothetical protein